VEMANSMKLAPHEAIIYISVHANASLNSKAKGFEVWYLPSDYRRTLIDQESIGTESEDVIPILNTMLEEEYTTESILLAQRILKGMDEKLGEYTENRGLKEEIWFVVRKAKMPSVLIELGFVTNREEALLLSRKEYLRKLSHAIYNGTSGFIDDFEATRGFTE
jgi:N-acetylmuramoyl-L-alanine amidase